MLFDTGARGCGVVEVDQVYTDTDGSRVGKKDEGTDHAITYVVFPSGNVGICKTVEIIDRSAEAAARVKKQLLDICYNSIPIKA